MANGGWIKLHRKIRDNWIWQDAEKLRAWLDILLMVNREDREVLFNGKIVIVKRGQKLTSISKLADKWNWNRKRVCRFLDLLSESEMCTTYRTTNGTIITVTNWDFYQLEGSTIGSTVGTTEGTAVGSTVGTQTRNKEYREGENKAPARREYSDEEIRAYLEAHKED